MHVAFSAMLLAAETNYTQMHILGKVARKTFGVVYSAALYVSSFAVFQIYSAGILPFPKGLM
jgi:hypothetical protein